ncbi:M20 family metallopeptidase [Haloarchaeobius sp. HRN-SO-5]|uniref:M20 family metallopeptidase n=1 Tax=Haloarchaeobius sp. HRN-SO-5 TaxID=3446118 RepID=UPI003EBEA495
MQAATPSEYVSEHRADLLDLTLDLLAIDTANPPGATSKLVDYVESSLPSGSLEVERFAVDPAKPNLLVTVPGRRDETLLFNGHLDTVPYDAEEWTHDPLGERDGDRIYGRGATDMKGPLAAMLFVLRAYVETDTEPPVTLAFAFVSDEEVGGDAGLPALLSADRLDADACVIGEPTCERGQHSVTVADRGSIWLTLDATGDAAHGSRPILGENAIDRLYDAVTRLRERFGRRRLSFDDAMAAIVDESVAFYEPTMGAAAARDLFTYPSINLGTLEGGEAINTVPQTARARVDIRLTAGVQTPEVLSEVRECISECEGITVTDVSWTVGTAEPVDSPLVDAVASTAEDVVGDHVYRRSATGGGDAKKLRNAGIPTVEFALGTDTVHAVDEYTTVEALVANANVYARLPVEWGRRVEAVS